MKTVLTTLSIVLLFLAGPARAQEEGPGEEPYDVEKAIREVRELLAKSEKLLVESLKEKADAAAAAEAGEATKQAIEELLNQSRNSGSDAAKKMIEIIENAPQGGGGGGGGGNAERKPEDASEDQRRKAEQEKLENRDPQNTGGEPKSPRESKDESESEDRTKPESESGEESKPDPASEFVPRLPPEVRQAYENRDWQRIPARWREYVEEYAKRLAEAESSRRQE